MDYDDQMTYAYAMLKRYPDILGYYQERYRYICVDEAQDTSRIQHEIIRLLTGRNDNIFMVGDEDQSIYGFRAAYPQALLSFEKDHPGGRVLLMEKNYRSGIGIVKAADRFIQKNEMRHPKSMEAAREDGSKVNIINVDSRRKQYEYLASMAEKNEMETAVLYRYNESVIPLVDILERRNVPYRLKETDAVFFTNRIVTDIRNILEFSMNPSDTELFMKLYYKLNTYLKKEQAEEACLISRQRGIPVLDAAMSLSSIASYTRDHLEGLRYDLESLKGLSPEKAIEKIEYYMGYGEYMARSGLKDDKLYIIKAVASGEKSVKGYLSRMEELKEIMGTRRYSDSNILLSTIHSSKGLEYDRVYLMDIRDYVFPQTIPGKKASPEERAEYEEERRIFYVGMTRAKEQLNIFRMGQSVFIDDIKEKKGKKPKKKVDLRKFVQEMEPGTPFIHEKLGEGTVISCNEDRTRIRLSDGSEKMLATAFAAGLMKKTDR